MANNFASDESCVGLWRFESGSLLTESLSGTLNFTGVNTPTADTTNYKEGSSSILLSSSGPKYAYIPDSSLPSNFPLKNNTSNKKITIAFWFRIISPYVNYSRMVSKFYGSGNKRSFLIWNYNSGTIIGFTIGSGSSYTDYTMFSGLTASRWYHLSFILDADAPFVRAFLYDSETGTQLSYYRNVLTTQLGLSDTDFMIGMSGKVGTGIDSSYTLNGNIDELVVFNRCLNPKEAILIRKGEYDGPTSFSKIWYIDPSNTDVNRDGLSWATASRSLISKTILSDEDVYVAETPTTNLSGTATATKGSMTVNTTNNLTGECPQYSVIKFDNEDTLYMVRAVSTSTITLYRPYRGQTGSGKVIKKFVLPTSFTSSNCWAVYYDGRTGRKDFHFGTNKTTGEQTGYTIIPGNGTLSLSPWDTKFTEYDFSRLIIYNFGYGFGSSASYKNCTFNKCFLMRSASYFSNYSTFVNCSFSDFVSELGRFASSTRICFCEFNGFETAETSNPGIEISSAVFSNNIIKRWKNVGYGSNYSLVFRGDQIENILFLDCNLDESGAGNPMIGAAQTSNVVVSRILFKNVKIGTGALYSPMSSSYHLIGKIDLAEVNGDPTAHYSIEGQVVDSSGRVTYVLPDFSVYKFSPPSLRINCNNLVNPYTQRFFVFMNADETKTVSAWLRKNSNYGSSNLPKMIVRYPTGTGSSMSIVEEVVEMENVTNTWNKVSVSITPSVDNLVIVDFVVMSNDANASVWIDSFEVS